MFFASSAEDSSVVLFCEAGRGFFFCVCQTDAKKQRKNHPKLIMM